MYYTIYNERRKRSFIDILTRILVSRNRSNPRFRVIDDRLRITQRSECRATEMLRGIVESCDQSINKRIQFG